jgi:formate hydrogenlyase transcriptional activator
MDKSYEMVGQSQALKYVLFKVEQVAPTDTTVLILGETGTGKEQVAHAVHAASARKDRPLVKMSCAALPSSLIESELFGHERGAFTGAQARKVGRFELAHRGTLFLDEVGELPPALQSKMLRFLEAGEFERLGGTQTLKVDVRIVAATNRDLRREVERGHFRADLWYRLNVYPITVPPLRRRKEDIPLLVDFFVNKFGRRFGKSIRSVPPDTMRALEDYDWPGNIRELANVIERAAIVTQGAELHLADRLDAAPSGTGHTDAEGLSMGEGGSTR